MRAHLEVADIFRAAGPGYRVADAGHLGLQQLKVMSTGRRAFLRHLSPVRKKRCRVGWGRYCPHPSQTRTCSFPASGSSW
ncbi:hypothetical protein FJW08_27120 [Mesorhizobium sp. B3-2-1]|nr:hypothetical protein FJW08_27120 [Mesorhizobium sp. B3-2-1]